MSNLQREPRTSMSQNQRRRSLFGPSRSAGGRESGSVSDSDALIGLREAVAEMDAGAFARCFCADGWVRVPRPGGDVILHGPVEIQQAGHRLSLLLDYLTWTPSQRFVASGQVVEE